MSIIIYNRVCAFANWGDTCGYFADWKERAIRFVPLSISDK